MKNFDWNGFKREKISVNCKTEEDVKDFFKHAKENGIIWCDKTELDEESTYWDNYGSLTCYHTGILSDKDYELSYSNRPEYDYSSIIWEREIIYSFQEVIANIKVGERYEALSKHYSTQNIYMTEDGDIVLETFPKVHKTIVPTFSNYIKVEGEKRIMYKCQVEHGYGGTLHTYYSKDIVSSNDIVSCIQEDGKSLYGICKVVEKEEIKITKIPEILLCTKMELY